MSIKVRVAGRGGGGGTRGRTLADIAAAETTVKIEAGDMPAVLRDLNVWLSTPLASCMPFMPFS